MKKWVCTVCGYVYEGENHWNFVRYVQPASKFKEESPDKTWAAEHVEWLSGCTGKISWLDVEQTSKVNAPSSMYSGNGASQRIGLYWEKAALKKLKAAKFAELGEVVTADKRTLMREMLNMVQQKVNSI